jgi:hypothetical protein
MLVPSAMALRLRAAAATAPFSVAPARFPFPAPAAAPRVQPAPLGQRAGRPLEEPVAWDVPEARQPALAGTVPRRVAEHEASAPQAAEHAGRQGEVAAAVAPVAVGAEAEQRVAAERAAAAEEEVARRREAQGAPGALPSGPPWEVAWAFRRDRLPLWPAPRPTARSARAMEQRPIGWP